MKSHWNHDNSHQQLRGNLDRLSGGGRWFLQRWRMREELLAASSVALLGLFVLPLLLLLVRLTRGLLGQASHPVNLWVVLILALVGPTAYILVRLSVVYFRYHPRRQAALALYDAELKTQDRLVTADEFLEDAAAAVGDQSYGFRQAAVADADQYARSALAAALSPLSNLQWRVRPISWLGIPAVIAVAALLYLGWDGAGLAQKTNEKALLVAMEASVDMHASEQEREAARKLVRRLEEQKKDIQLAMLEKQEVMPSKNRKSRNEKGTEGKSNTGNAAMAQSMSTSSSAAGDPSSQKNASKPKKPEEEKPPEEDKNEEKKNKKKKDEQKTAPTAMSATSGEGKLAMSKSSPSEFDMPEQEDKATPGTKQEGADEDSEDEDEQEKTNGVDKPSLNQKLSPMNRDLDMLTVHSDRSLFDKPSNGRSGGAGRKKTRGVPSMVLGVPVPDRVVGMSHPGRSKVTQEDAKPTPESNPTLEAQLRLARADTMGRVAHPGLLRWMQTVVENYFVAIRQDSTAGNADEQN